MYCCLCLGWALNTSFGSPTWAFPEWRPISFGGLGLDVGSPEWRGKALHDAHDWRQEPENTENTLQLRSHLRQGGTLKSNPKTINKPETLMPKGLTIRAGCWAVHLDLRGELMAWMSNTL